MVCGVRGQHQQRIARGEAAAMRRGHHHHRRADAVGGSSRCKSCSAQLSARQRECVVKSCLCHQCQPCRRDPTTNAHACTSQHHGTPSAGGAADQPHLRPHLRIDGGRGLQGALLALRHARFTCWKRLLRDGEARDRLRQEMSADLGAVALTPSLLRCWMTSVCCPSPSRTCYHCMVAHHAARHTLTVRAASACGGMSACHTSGWYLAPTAWGQNITAPPCHPRTHPHASNTPGCRAQVCAWRCQPPATPQ